MPREDMSVDIRGSFVIGLIDYSNVPTAPHDE